MHELTSGVDEDIMVLAAVQIIFIGLIKDILRQNPFATDLMESDVSKKLNMSLQLKCHCTLD